MGQLGGASVMVLFRLWRHDSASLETKGYGSQCAGTSLNIEQILDFAVNSRHDVVKSVRVKNSVLCTLLANPET